MSNEYGPWDAKVSDLRLHERSGTRLPLRGDRWEGTSNSPTGELVSLAAV